MSEFGSYSILIAGSVIVILSYVFNIISRKTSLPSVLLLIGTGILINIFLKLFNLKSIDFMPLLEILGIIGLIMIVLEASLDLKLSKEKRRIIWSSFGIAFVSLLITTSVLSIILLIYLDTDLFHAVIYALPLSIISSAIVIPSTSNLDKDKKEFMVYESTFSDILGIMFFYFLIQSANTSNFTQISINLILNVLATVSISFVVSYLLILVFQNIKTQVKLFLLISVLILLYSIAKLMHLSSLLIILVFGLMLENRHIFFAGSFKNLINEKSLQEISSNFRIITLESAFVVRTFFFVIFGITITLSSLYNLQVLLVSLVILLSIFIIRYLVFKIFRVKNFFPELFLAPRGLITILLFYAIPPEIQDPNFDPGVLLFIIIATSLAMTISLVRAKNRQKLNISFPSPEKKSEDTHHHN